MPPLNMPTMKIHKTLQSNGHLQSEWPINEAAIFCVRRQDLRLFRGDGAYILLAFGFFDANVKQKTKWKSFVTAAADFATIYSITSDKFLNLLIYRTVIWRCDADPDNSVTKICFCIIASSRRHGNSRCLIVGSRCALF
jgi:hypothetical protein